mgnify:CR=1 FL=1
MECIICKRDFPEDQFVPEHVFPESIGGSFILNNAVCENCNHLLGSKVDSLLINNFLTVMKRCRFKIKNKKGEVPTFYGTGTLDSNPNQKILWDSDKNGTPINLHLYPQIDCKVINENQVEVNVSADASYGEEKILDMVTKKMERMGRKISKEELKKQMGPLNPKKMQSPTIQFQDKINTLEYKAAIVKIIYEMAHYWLGNQYLIDETGEKFRCFLHDIIHKNISVLECMDKYGLNGKAEIVNDKTEILGHKNCHYVIIFQQRNRILCHLNIFDLFKATIPLTYNASNYTDFKNKCLILNYTNNSYIECPITYNAIAEII